MGKAFRQGERRVSESLFGPVSSHANREAKASEQARQQAERLRAFHTKAAGEPIAVAPILTLADWFVSSRANERMKVLNPKQIWQVVLNTRGAKLAPALIQRISH